jgi:HlyD family secretion protein
MDVRPALRPEPTTRPARLRPALWLLAALAASGCSEDKKVAPSVTEPPALSVIRPQLRKIVRVVGQPSFVQSYERTSIYPKLTAYIEKWNVDIGDKVRKGDVLADLFVPELREQWVTKKATVGYQSERVSFALKDVEVAAAQVEAAKARLTETKAILAKYEAEVERWDVQVKRLAREVQRQVVAPQILLESQNELKADIAARDAARATIEKAAADLQASQATLERAKVNVGVARADLAVAQSEAKRLEALVGYLKLFAPYDGIIVARNANTWDFVLPRTGDPTAEMRSPDLSPGEKAAPIYVVDRTDIVRIFVDIPERDADYVHTGSEARVKLWAYRDAWLPAAVTRLSWALNVQSRTMRAEIDLPNPGGKILPGMYAYGKVVVERPDARAVLGSTLSHAGGKTFYWRYEKGRAVRTEVQTGVTDGDWVELTNRRVGADSPGEENWVPIDGSEKILSGSKLSILTEGAPVRVDGPTPPEQEGPETTAPDATASHHRGPAGSAGRAG